MTGLPGVFRSTFLKGNDAGSAPKANISVSASVFRGLAQSPPSDAFRPTGFRGKRRSGGAQRLVLVPRLAVLPHSAALALAQDLPDPVEDGQHILTDPFVWFAFSIQITYTKTL